MDAEEVLQRGNRQLAAENLRLKNTINQRGADTVGEFVDGLGVLLTMAAQGSPDARSLLTLLWQRMDEARAAGAGLVVVKGS